MRQSHHNNDVVLIDATPPQWNSKSAKRIEPVEINVNNLYVQYKDIVITNGDLNLLKSEEWLNDTIIDFSLRYMYDTQLGGAIQQLTHIYSSFFYTDCKKLFHDLCSTAPEDNMYKKLKKWSKHIDIFDKNYLIIPQCHNAHWTLIVVCYANKRVKLSESQIKLIEQYRDDTCGYTSRNRSKRKSTALSQIRSTNKHRDDVPDKRRRTSIRQAKAYEQSHQRTLDIYKLSSKYGMPRNSKRFNQLDKTDTIDLLSDDDGIIIKLDDNDLYHNDTASSSTSTAFNNTNPTPHTKQSPPQSTHVTDHRYPCIIIFDSSDESIDTDISLLCIRRYLTNAWSELRPSELPIDFDDRSIPEYTIQVPKQPNSFDCGCFILEFAQQFLRDPFIDTTPELLTSDRYGQWFNSHELAETKRATLHSILYQLRHEQNKITNQSTTSTTNNASNRYDDVEYYQSSDGEYVGTDGILYFMATDKSSQPINNKIIQLNHNFQSRLTNTQRNNKLSTNQPSHSIEYDVVYEDDDSLNRLATPSNNLAPPLPSFTLSIFDTTHKQHTCNSTISVLSADAIGVVVSSHAHVSNSLPQFHNVRKSSPTSDIIELSDSE